MVSAVVTPPSRHDLFGLFHSAISGIQSNGTPPPSRPPNGSFQLFKEGVGYVLRYPDACNTVALIREEFGARGLL